MQEYVITREDLRRWCSIPLEKLEQQPNQKMKLILRERERDVAAEVGNLLAEEVIRNNRSHKPTRWILPGGPAQQYDVFTERVNRESISLKNLHIFHMDTWLDWQYRLFPPENTRFSCKAKMEKIFYGKINPSLNVPEAQRYFPDPLEPDRFDEAIEELGGIDTLVGGVGCKGLVAFNESPASPYHRVSLEEYAQSKSRIVTLREDTIIAYAEREFGACFDALPPNAFTIGMKSMLKAQRAVFVVTTGAWKQTVVRVALFSEPTTEYPVTLFPRYVPECVLYCDRGTADHVISRKYQDIPILK